VILCSHNSACSCDNVDRLARPDCGYLIGTKALLLYKGVVTDLRCKTVVHLSKQYHARNGITCAPASTLSR
jgi:hypothetical protein